MSKTIAFFALVASSLMLQSFAGKGKKARYVFPKEMTPAARTEFQKICEKGEALYESACAGCHNVRLKGKWVIPDFTPDQVNGYEIRIGNGDHIRTLSDDAITTEELGFIATFLLYKEKSGGKVADAFGGKLCESNDH